jgi:integrase/recombinase XerC
MLDFGVRRMPRGLALLRASVMTSRDLDAVLEVVEAVWASDVDTGDMSDQTFDRYLALVGQFTGFAQANGITTLDGSLQVYEAWLLAWGRDRSGHPCPPGLSVRHLRSCAVRALFHTARTLGLTTLTPAYQSRELGAAARKGRSLNEAEADILRSVATTYQHTRLATAAAVGLAGGGSADIASMGPEHVDLDEGTLRLPGGRQVAARTVAIPGQWEYEVLATRLADLREAGGPGSGLVVSRTGDAQSRQAGAAIALGEILQAAGLRSDPDIKPASIQRWAATVAFESGGGISAAARLLGVSSLDTAAAAIGWDWTEQPPLSAPLRPNYQPRVLP